MQYPDKGLVRLCRLFGLSRQAYYKHNWGVLDRNKTDEIILKLVRKIRETHPRIGTRKLHQMLQPLLLEHEIKIGRDGLFNLLANNHLLIRRRKRKVYTTQSQHWLRKYPNLIKGIRIQGVNQLWVSDITYWKIYGGHVYISFITDAYSHTPGGSGVKQPGLTGQVKEDVISRFAELGLRVANGRIHFDLSLLDKNEFLAEKKEFEFISTTEEIEIHNIEKDRLAFSFCQIPVIIGNSDHPRINIYFKDKSRKSVEGNEIDNDLSRKIFERTGEIVKIEYAYGKKLT